MQFNGRDVFDFFPHFDAPGHGQLDDVTLNPVGIGPGTPWKPTTTVRRSIKIPFRLRDRIAWRQFRDLIASHRGRGKGFWLPIWLTDYPSTFQDAGQNAILIDNIGLQGVFTAGGQFAFCALIKPSGPDGTGIIEPHQIDSIAPAGDQEQLNLVDNIVESFPTTPGGAVLCGMMFVRIDDKEVIYNFVTDGYVETAVTFVELPKEYAADEDIETPVYLIEFRRGGQTWRVTNFGKSLVVNSELYVAENIDIGTPQNGMEFLSEGIEMTIATDRLDHPMAYYVNNPQATERTDITIYRIDASNHLPSPDDVFYAGMTAASRRTKEGQIEFVCSSLFRLGEMNVPRPQNQRFCNHRFGDDFCTLSEGAFTTNGTVSGFQSIDPPYIEAAAFGAKAVTENDPNWFAYGTVTIGSETRTCMGQNGNRLYLNVGFLNVQIAAAVSAVAGDDKRIGTCLAKFDNVVNFLGGPYVPNENNGEQAIMNTQSEGGKK